MAKLVHIPEAALEALLREAGHPESVDDYLRSAEVQVQVATGQRLLKRARAAYWSRFWLALSAAVTVVSFLSGPNIEDFISGVLLIGMTVVEFKVYHFFLAGDVRGSIYGWWNQCLFAALFVIYGVYHGTFVSISPSLQSTLDAVGDTSILPVAGIESLTYYTIAIVGGIGQFILACYYRTARR